jgi:hypothetical protein
MRFTDADDIIEEREASEAQAAEKNKRASRKQLRLTLLMAILSVLLVICGFYFTSKPDNVPAELIGVWKTQSPGYTDRYIEIRPVTISFGTGAGTELTGFIQEVQATRGDDGVLYTVNYSANGVNSKVSFTYSPQDGNTIRLVHQESIVWKKK